MLNYVHDIPTKIYFGKNQISQLESILKPLGKKVLLAYGGGSIKKTGLYDTVKEILDAGDFEVVELSGIAPNPRIESVVEGVALCKHHQIDVPVFIIRERIYGKWSKRQIIFKRLYRLLIF